MASDYRTYRDIFDQAGSLEQTLLQLDQNWAPLRRFYTDAAPARLVFVGCGSSYSVSLSVGAAMQRTLGIPVHTLYGGDLMRHPDLHAAILQNALVVTLSRSGSTTETLYGVRQAKERFGVRHLSIDCAPGSPLNTLADYAISLPWAREEAVCQTKAVSNLYLAGMLTAACWGESASLRTDLAGAVAAAGPFLQAMPWQPWADRDWQKVVVLGDGEQYGAAQEGALVMLEMAEMPATFYSTLDVRHGPTVLVDQSTLVVLFCSAENAEWEVPLVADLRQRGATVLTIAAQNRAGYDGIALGTIWSDAAQGLLSGMVTQAIALKQAERRGVNPDQPKGLTPWIDLSGGSAR
jgi:glucosamine--fructose-6-phosphate aminotransferase (isomerizing)